MDSKQMDFIDGILNSQRYRDETLRPIVVSFIHDHHLMLIFELVKNGGKLRKCCVYIFDKCNCQISLHKSMNLNWVELV